MLGYTILTKYQVWNMYAIQGEVELECMYSTCIVI